MEDLRDQILRSLNGKKADAFVVADGALDVGDECGDDDVVLCGGVGAVERCASSLKAPSRLKRDALTALMPS